jgi:hypothetical protein
VTVDQRRGSELHLRVQLVENGIKYGEGATADMTRSTKRIKLIYQLRVFDARSGALLGHIVDLTPQGFHLIGENPVPVAAAFFLRMEVPSPVIPARRLSFTAESKWCRRDSGGGFYGTGFGILEMSEDSLAVVRGLIRDFYQEDGDADETVEFNPVVPDKG